jgi:hypothetical protein
MVIALITVDDEVFRKVVTGEDPEAIFREVQQKVGGEVGLYLHQDGRHFSLEKKAKSLKKI